MRAIVEPFLLLFAVTKLSTPPMTEPLSFPPGKCILVFSAQRALKQMTLTQFLCTTTTVNFLRGIICTNTRVFN